YSETPTIHISISNAPSSSFQKPMFRPKPSPPSDSDKYVLVQTIPKPNKTQEIQSIVNILQMLNESSTSTSKKPPSTSYVFSATPTRRPSYEPPITTKKPPSTSYVFSTTFKPRRTTTPLTTTTTTTRKRTKPTKNSNKKT